MILGAIFWITMTLKIQTPKAENPAIAENQGVSSFIVIALHLEKAVVLTVSVLIVKTLRIIKQERTLFITLLRKIQTFLKPSYKESPDYELKDVIAKNQIAWKNTVNANKVMYFVLSSAHARDARTAKKVKVKCKLKIRL